MSFPAHADPRYHVVDLGSFAGASNFAPVGINEAGDVVGDCDLSDGGKGAFLSHAGTMVEIKPNAGDTNCRGKGVDSGGDVLILSYTPQTLPDGGDASTLPHLNEGYLVNVKQPGAPTYTAIANFDEYNSLNTAAINNAGTIVGFSLSWSVGADPHQTKPSKAFSYSGGKITELQGLGEGHAHATAIASNGLIAGEDEIVMGRLSAVTWADPATPKVLTGVDGFEQSTADAIDAGGDVAGTVSHNDRKTGVKFRAVLWIHGKPKVLASTAPGRSTVAGGINDRGVVVGHEIAGETTRAVMWNGSGVHDLNHLIPAGEGWRLTEADAINNRGEIAGIGMHDGKERAYLLAP